MQGNARRFSRTSEPPLLPQAGAISTIAAPNCAAKAIYGTRTPSVLRPARPARIEPCSEVRHEGPLRTFPFLLASSISAGRSSAGDYSSWSPLRSWQAFICISV